jgi:hypothetical protein
MLASSEEANRAFDAGCSALERYLVRHIVKEEGEDSVSVIVEVRTPFLPYENPVLVKAWARLFVVCECCPSGVWV